MKPASGRSVKSAWRPSWKEILASPVHVLAFGLGAGLSPVAPGTVGTLVGIPLWFLISPLPTAAYFGILTGLFLFGCWLCGASARRLGVHDYSGIVFDEVVGFLVTCIPLLAVMAMNPFHEAVGLAIAFVAFRVFDIWKPWPIGWLDRRVHGGLGIMLDDLVAGLYAALVLILVIGIANDPEFR